MKTLKTGKVIISFHSLLNLLDQDKVKMDMVYTLEGIATTNKDMAQEAKYQTE